MEPRPISFRRVLEVLSRERRTVATLTFGVAVVLLLLLAGFYAPGVMSVGIWAFFFIATSSIVLWGVWDFAFRRPGRARRR